MNYYEKLSIDPSATQYDIKQAFRKKAKKCHPDMVSGNSDEFVEIFTAYKILLNKRSRKLYDESLHTNLSQKAQASYAKYQKTVYDESEKLSDILINFFKSDAGKAVGMGAVLFAQFIPAIAIGFKVIGVILLLPIVTILSDLDGTHISAWNTLLTTLFGIGLVYLSKIKYLYTKESISFKSFGGFGWFTAIIGFIFWSLILAQRIIYWFFSYFGGINGLLLPSIEFEIIHLRIITVAFVMTLFFIILKRVKINEEKNTITALVPLKRKDTI